MDYWLAGIMVLSMILTAAVVVRVIVLLLTAG